MATLEVTQGPDAGNSFPLVADELFIGRAQDADVTLNDPTVSRRHARITRENEGYILVDMGSASGTLVNGHRAKRVPLESGDEIRLGDTVLQFSFATEPQSAAVGIGRVVAGERPGAPALPAAELVDALPAGANGQAEPPVAAPAGTKRRTAARRHARTTVALPGGKKPPPAPQAEPQPPVAQPAPAQAQAPPVALAADGQQGAAQAQVPRFDPAAETRQTVEQPPLLIPAAGEPQATAQPQEPLFAPAAEVQQAAGQPPVFAPAAAVQAQPPVAAPASRTQEAAAQPQAQAPPPVAAPVAANGQASAPPAAAAPVAAAARPDPEPVAAVVDDEMQQGPAPVALAPPIRVAERVRTGRPVVRIPFARPLVKRVTCPNCWHGFSAEEVLFIAKHPELIGDPIAGANEYSRFLPSRFTVNGEALDDRGFPTSDLACPRCHLPMPRAALEVRQIFISIVGSPASGKSYFLTAMTWELRRTLPRFGLVFQDADPVANSVIREGELGLFRNPNPDELTEIPKTQQDDPRLHKTVHINGVDIRHPIPFQFFMSPTRRHAMQAEAGKIGRTIVLYDNAGEDCLPSVEAAESAAVKHLARSGIIFLVFDPTQDPAFRAQCASEDPQLSDGLRPGTGAARLPYTQGTIANELAVRIRRYHAMPHDKRIGKPLIVILAKFDIWGGLAGVSIDDEPFVENDDGSPARLDLKRIKHTSDALRDFLEVLCPDFVAIADSISEHVHYVPVTSLGHSPVIVRKDNAAPFYGIRPKDMRPRWVTVPLLFCLSNWGPRGLLRVTKGPQTKREERKP